MDQKLEGFLWLLLACSLALAAQIFLFSPIESPQTLVVPAPALLTPTNNHLQSVIKLGEGFLKDPEDIAIDKEGVLYTTTRDGWIKRLHKNGTWEKWKMLGGHALLGLTISYHDDRQRTILVCDAEKGLLKVGEDGVTILSSHVNDSKLRFADDVVEAWDGSAYFSEASTKFGFEDWRLDLLEAKPHGLLLKYDPSSNLTSILLHGLFFPNGVALSKHQDFLVVCETWKFRCLKYWLRGDKKGTTEVFIENLPGGPDNINLAPDGSFWIALIKLRSRGWEFVHESKVCKYVMATFPNLLKLAMGTHYRATAIKVDADGNIIKRVDDPDGKVMSFVTSALEFDHHLYLGSLNANFVGKLPLHDA